MAGVRVVTEATLDVTSGRFYEAGQIHRGRRRVPSRALEHGEVCVICPRCGTTFASDDCRTPAELLTDHLDGPSMCNQ
jgi:hypothetical protein